ncbi:hypothetical protein [Eisenbergiella sp.]
MADNELLLAISDMLDRKLKSELQPVKDDIQSIKDDIRNMDGRLEKVESQISALRSGQIETRKEIKEVSIKVSETYALALDSWGQSTENRQWLEKI